MIFINKNMNCQYSNKMFYYRIKFKFNQKIYIKIMMCKIIGSQNLMCHNIMRTTKKKKKLWFYTIGQGLATNQFVIRLLQSTIWQFIRPSICII